MTDGPALFFPDGRLKYDDKGRRVGAKLCVVQWRGGNPVPVYPPSIASQRCALAEGVSEFAALCGGCVCR